VNANPGSHRCRALLATPMIWWRSRANVSAGDSTNSGDSRNASNGTRRTRRHAVSASTSNGQRSSGTEILLDGVENSASSPITWRLHSAGCYPGVPASRPATTSPNTAGPPADRQRDDEERNQCISWRHLGVQPSLRLHVEHCSQCPAGSSKGKYTRKPVWLRGRPPNSQGQAVLLRQHGVDPGPQFRGKYRSRPERRSSCPYRSQYTGFLFRNMEAERTSTSQRPTLPASWNCRSSGQHAGLRCRGGYRPSQHRRQRSAKRPTTSSGGLTTT